MRPLYLFATLIWLTTGAAFGQGYAWFVNEEPRPYGEAGDMPGFGTGDTINGRVHSNGQIAISGSPVFYGQVSTTEPDFFHGPDYNPIFLGAPPIFGTLPQPLQDMSSNLRAHATIYMNPGPGFQQRMVIDGSTAHVYTWGLGQAFDTLSPPPPTDVPITNNSCFFTEVPLELMGTNITGRITIGSARQIRLMNDVRVGGPTSGPPQYRVYENNVNYVGIVSEGDIKVANVPANGRLNSDSLGPSQMNQGLTNIVITAAVVAYGSFTFENENDADSGYVCECSPDYRGKVYLWGAVAEGSRGFHWRTNNGGTGYEMMLRYDPRFIQEMPPCFSGPYGSPHTDPEELDFGDVPLDSTVWDTVDVYVAEFGALALVNAPVPFDAHQIPPQYGTHFRVPVSFNPHYATQYSSILQVLASGHLFQVPLHGHGVNSGGPQIVGPNAYPNPFNASTAITFEVTAAGQATLELFDITGRRVMTAFNQHVEPGTQRVIINGESLSTGIYFARLRAPSQERTLKLMLVK